MNCATSAQWRASRHSRGIGGADRGRSAEVSDLPVNETQGRSAEADDCGEIVADKENRPTFSGRDTLDFANALALKLSVANRQNLVHDEYLRFQMCGDGKGELDPHVPGSRRESCRGSRR